MIAGVNPNLLQIRSIKPLGRSSSTLAPRACTPARPHAAFQRRLQLEVVAKSHKQTSDAERSDIDQLDARHGQKQHQQDPRGQGPPRWRAWLGSIPKILPLFRQSSDAEETATDGKAWSWKYVLAHFRMLLLGCLAGCMLLLVRYTAILQARSAPKEVLYSDFVALLDARKVKAARLEAASSRLFFECHPAEKSDASATAAAAVASSSSSSSSSSASAAEAVAAVTPAAAKPALRRRFFIKLADKQDQLLVGKIIAAGVEYAVIRASFQQQLQHLLLTVLSLWIPLIPLLFLAQRLVDSRSGSRKAKMSGTKTPSITFADVAGVSSAKEELREVVACLRNAAQYQKVRARMPSGVLLCGPPGTGKTLLAKAVAGEAGVPFIAVAASEFVELFVGRGAARVRELFAEARKSAPCVVFIDEIDALGGKRGMGFNDERDQTLNQLLTELDGFNGRPGVMLLAATNRVDVLDPALLRPGRISRRVVVPLPDEAGRAAILGVHLRQVDLEGGEVVKTEVARQVARITPGFSGAELANVVNEALLLVARRNGEQVGLSDLLDGVRRTRYGVNGGAGGGGALLGSQTALGKRIGKWLIEATQPRSGKLVKTATS